MGDGAGKLDTVVYTFASKSCGESLMSEQGTLFGCIYGGGLIGSPKSMDFYQHNQRVIAELPEKINWREKNLVVRHMFTVPMPDKDGFYRLQMIHFAASFNHLDLYWESWIIGFENLLKNLFWFESYTYMQAELSQSCNAYHWQADPAPMFKTPRETIQTWTFTGGTRKLWNDSMDVI
jgi:hypothetical protein